MFDFAWSEIALIGIVALVAIGPKDMPVAIKTMADLVKKGRRMAGEFQTHVDEMVREANLHEVRDQFNDLRGMNLRDKITRSVDRDGSLRRALTEDPLKPGAAPVAAALVVVAEVGATGEVGATQDGVGENSIGTPRPVPASLQAVPPPSFLPPATVPPKPVPIAAAAPSFIPPGAVMPPGVSYLPLPVDKAGADLDAPAA